MRIGEYEYEESIEPCLLIIISLLIVTNPKIPLKHSSLSLSLSLSLIWLRICKFRE